MTSTAETQNFLEKLRTEISRGSRLINLSGLTSTASKAFVLSRLKAESSETFVIVVDQNSDIETWKNDLTFWQNEQSENAEICRFPSFEADPYSGVSPHAEAQEERALALWRLTKQAPEFFVLSAKSLAIRTPTKETIKNLGATLTRDKDFAPEKLIERLFASGYKREEPISNIGEFSMPRRNHRYLVARCG